MAPHEILRQARGDPGNISEGLADLYRGRIRTRKGRTIRPGQVFDENRGRPHAMRAGAAAAARLGAVKREPAAEEAGGGGKRAAKRARGVDQMATTSSSDRRSEREGMREEG